MVITEVPQGIASPRNDMRISPHGTFQPKGTLMAALEVPQGTNRYRNDMGINPHGGNATLMAGPTRSTP